MVKKRNLSSLNDARQAVRTLQLYLEGCEGVNDCTFSEIGNIATILDRSRKFKQCTLDDYFQKHVDA